MGPGGGAARVAVLLIAPDGEHNSYEEFVKVLVDKERVGVAKWGDYTLFLVPPGPFTHVSQSESLLGALHLYLLA